MANDFTHNPLILDTAHATDVIWPERIIIDRIDWVDMTTAGDQVTLKDSADRVVYDATVSAADLQVSRSFGENLARNFNGLKLTKIGSGKLYVYYR